MKILRLLWQNLVGGTHTLRFPARPDTAPGFRGQVLFTPELCTGCGTCKFRCTSRAITFTPGKGEYTWAYNPGQCTFCGRCVEGCKPGALSQEAAPPPLYTTPGELSVEHTLQRKPPARPATQPAQTASQPESSTPPAVLEQPEHPAPATPLAHLVQPAQSAAQTNPQEVAR